MNINEELAVNKISHLWLKEIKNKVKIIGFPHPPQPYGGPGSFQVRLEKELIKLRWKVVYPDQKVCPDVILVVGGTKKVLC